MRSHNIEMDNLPNWDQFKLTEHRVAKLCKFALVRPVILPTIAFIIRFVMISRTLTTGENIVINNRTGRARYEEILSEKRAAIVFATTSDTTMRNATMAVE